MDLEIWKECIRDMDYQVSSYGRIKNSEGYIHNPKPHSTGYIRVHMKKTKNRCFPLHVLIAETFIPNPNNYKYVHHIDGNKQNNEVSNLTWVEKPTKTKAKIKNQLVENEITFTDEMWKDVTFENNLYKVSNYGRIELKSGLKTYGYLTADKYLAFKTTDKKSRRIHNVICTAFHGPKPSKKHVVNHKDFNKMNNKPENLEWITQSNNVKYSIHLRKKEIVHNRKKIAQYTCVGCFVKQYDSVSEASKITNINRSGIQQYLSGKYNHTNIGGYIWKYVE